MRMQPDTPRNMSGKYSLGVAPGVGGRTVQRRIGIENAAPVSIERLRAFLRRQQFEKIIAEIGIEARQRVEKCTLQFGAGAEEGGAQRDAGDPVGVGLRIGQSQLRAPGAADDHPALKAKFLADAFHVRDQMRQRIVLEAALWAATTGAALIEQDGVKTLGIE